MNDVAEQLRRDVVAHPSDDTPRRILADWWIDHGQETRGEFVLAQCDAAATPRMCPRRRVGCYCEDSACRCTHRRRADAFDVAALSDALRACGDTFDLHAMYRDVGHKSHRYLATRGDAGGVEHVIFSRGFVSSVKCSQAWWTTHGPTLFARQPLRSVAISDAEIRGVVEGITGRTLFYTTCVTFGEWSSFNAYVPTRPMALQLVSDAALRYAREVNENAAAR